MPQPLDPELKAYIAEQYKTRSASDIAAEIGKSRRAVQDIIRVMRQKGVDIPAKAKPRTPKRGVWYLKRDNLTDRHVPKRCEGCIYRRRILAIDSFCDYLFIEGKQRPCPAEECTVKKAVAKMEIPKPNRFLRDAFRDYIVYKEK